MGEITPMHSIQPFIDQGYLTVPLASTHIKRTKEGKKEFRVIKNWQRFLTERNDTPSQVGAIITGKDSGVIAIDCDGQAGYNTMKALDPNYKAVMVSNGKLDSNKNPIDAGTFLYLWSKQTPPTRNKGPLDIEIFNGGSARMVFLPTHNNETKVPWNTLPQLKEPPENVIEFLNAIHTLTQPQHNQQTKITLHQTNHQTNNIGMRLEPLIAKFVQQGTYLPQLFKVITPIVYRSPKYHKQQHLHPQDITDRSDYLFKISTMLGYDISIDEDLYIQAINLINSLFKEPLAKQRVTTEITSPMLTTSTHEGKRIWAYDPNWETQALMLTNKKGNLIEYFYDDIQKMIVEINHTEDTIAQHTHQNIQTHIKLSVIEPPKKQIIEQRLQNYTCTLEPHKPFGLVTGTHDYNIFRASPALRVMNDPSEYELDYTVPKAFIQYMEHFIPVENDRTYLLRHMLTKYTTFKHSPVIYYIVGAQGSGKGRFVTLNENLLGKDYCSTEIGGPALMEQSGFNAWMYNKYFVHFDELHQELKSYEVTAATEKLKRYSGAETFQLRTMQKDLKTAPMLATFCLTQNGTNLYISPDDRRFLYIDTPKRLDQTLAEQLSYELDNNMEDIAYYIATEYKPLNSHEYLRAPMTEEKQRMMVNNMPLSTALVTFIKFEMYDLLYEKMIEADIPIEQLEEWKGKNKIKTEVLANIYNALSDKSKDGLALIKDVVKKQLPNQPKHPYTGANIHYIETVNFDTYINPYQLKEEE